MRYLKKLVRTIKKNKRIVVATHIDPDADGIAAALSCAYLVAHYKRRKPILYCSSPIPAKYSFLLQNNRFVRKLSDFDLLIAVDSAGISRIFPQRDLFGLDLDNKDIINIDHHKSNDAFGILKIIEEDVSSACEIVYNIFRKLKININKPLAEIFYCGIYSETGGFIYPNTTKESLLIASELIACGVEPAPLVKKLNAKTINGTKLLSQVLKTIEVKNGVGVMYVTQAMLKKSKAKMSDSENFVSFLQAISDVKVSLFLREEDKGTRISLRSDGILDVDQLAARYGGGGHRLAAGVRIKKPLKVIKKELFEAILSAFKKNK